MSGCSSACLLQILLGLTAKVALGETHEVVNVGGLTTFFNNGTVASAAPLGTSTAPGGILNVATNSGRTTHDQFSVIPEVELRAGFAFTDNIRAFVGYDFMYWTNVARPGEQNSSVVDLRSIPSIATFVPGMNVGPAPVYQKSDFWAQGVTFGLQLAF